MGKKQEDLKQIIKSILNTGKLTGITRSEIEKAIIKTTWARDQRSIDNWFTLIFRLEYIDQPQLGKYRLNLSEIALLDIEIPNNNQQRLDNV